MSDPKNPKELPPDDFSLTVPNIRTSPPKENITDWEKTVYGSKESQEFSSQTDWNVTQQNMSFSSSDFSSQSNNAREEDFGVTKPYISLPENVRNNYQSTAVTETSDEERKKGSGVPGWAWLSLGMLLMFLFAVIILFGVYWFFLNKKGFDVTIKGAPAGSDIRVGNTRWNLSSPDGSYKLKGLEAGEHVIKIVHPDYTCEDLKIVGEDGKALEAVIAKCRENTKKQPIVDDCQNIKNGEFDKAERCANLALDNLSDPFTAEQLTNALNIYIINFSSGSFSIPSRNMKFLQRAATFIQKLPQSVVLEVGGHTDNRGSQASNQKLSDNRSKAVKEALAKMGVKAEMLQTKGYGDSKPKVSNDTEDGRFLNRRIEYTVLSK